MKQRNNTEHEDDEDNPWDANMLHDIRIDEVSYLEHMFYQLCNAKYKKQKTLLTTFFHDILRKI